MVALAKKRVPTGFWFYFPYNFMFWCKKKKNTVFGGQGFIFYGLFLAIKVRTKMSECIFVSMPQGF